MAGGLLFFHRMMTLGSPQPGILAPVPRAGRYLTFAITAPQATVSAMASLCGLVDGDRLVLGLGQSLVRQLGRRVAGLKTFNGPGVLPRPAALWCWLRGDDRGELLLASRRLQKVLAPAFVTVEIVDAFRYTPADCDLSGYRDGTANPRGDDAIAAALVTGRGPGIDGSSFAVVQQWLHDFERLERIAADAMDLVIGRRKTDDTEIDGAPASSHLRRTDQESFNPAAPLLRRSMPWSDARQAGLMFAAFGRSFEAFEAQWKRMTGGEDGLKDDLFQFSRPIGCAYFWCPPLKNGRLDLSTLGIATT